MKTIWKYEIIPCSEFTIEMPEGAHVLSVQMQGVRPYMWVGIEDTEAPKCKRTFSLFATGIEIKPSEDTVLSYIGTFQLIHQHLVFHLFEKTIYPLSADTSEFDSALQDTCKLPD